MSDTKYDEWFEKLRHTLETAYLQHEEPWKQSGFAGPYERWEAVRRPIADCMDVSGAFLDIGCANGYLLECVMKWTKKRGVSIEPWGLDLSEKLVALAKKRLPEYEANIFAANGFYWSPPRKFDYARIELCDVPGELKGDYVGRLYEEFLNDGGKLLVAEYRSKADSSEGPWVDDVLEEMGYGVEYCVSGMWEGKEHTRIAVIKR